MAPGKSKITKRWLFSSASRHRSECCAPGKADRRHPLPWKFASSFITARARDGYEGNESDRRRIVINHYKKWMIHRIRLRLCQRLRKHLRLPVVPGFGRYRTHPSCDYIPRHTGRASAKFAASIPAGRPADAGRAAIFLAPKIITHTHQPIVIAVIAARGILPSKPAHESESDIPPHREISSRDTPMCTTRPGANRATDNNRRKCDQRGSVGFVVNERRGIRVTDGTHAGKKTQRHWPNIILNLRSRLKRIHPLADTGYYRP